MCASNMECPHGSGIDAVRVRGAHNEFLRLCMKIRGLGRRNMNFLTLALVLVLGQRGSKVCFWVFINFLLFLGLWARL